MLVTLPYALAHAHWNCLPVLVTSGDEMTKGSWCRGVLKTM